MIFIVEYTNEDCTGNQCMQMEIEAADLEEAYEIVDDIYDHLNVDTVYPKTDARRTRIRARMWEDTARMWITGDDE